MALPTFFIVGAAKCGTTSLAAYLKQHPDVFFSAYKEPNFFAFYGAPLPLGGPVPPEIVQALYYSRTLNDWEAYRAAFADAGGAKAIGDASVRYLYDANAAARIRQHVPDARIVIVLRDPVRRLYSHYAMNRQHQLEPLDLRAALAAEPERIARGWGWDWHYAAVSRYADQVERYLHQFGPEAVKVFLYEDYAADPMGVLRSVCAHIGVDPAFEPDLSLREKVTTAPRNLALDRWLNWPNPAREALEKGPLRRVAKRGFDALRARNAGKAEPFDPALKAELSPLFRDDVARLSSLLASSLGRPLAWA